MLIPDRRMFRRSLNKQVVTTGPFQPQDPWILECSPYLDRGKFQGRRQWWHHPQRPSLVVILRSGVARWSLGGSESRYVWNCLLFSQLCSSWMGKVWECMAKSSLNPLELEVPYQTNSSEADNLWLVVEPFGNITCYSPGILPMKQPRSDGLNTLNPIFLKSLALCLH